MLATAGVRCTFLCALVLLAGCRQLFGIDDTVAAADGRVDPPKVDGSDIDGRPDVIDARLDARICGDGYVTTPAYPGHSYRPSAGGAAWGAAQAACLDQGAYLVVIDGEEESAAVRALTPIDKASPYFWTGVSDSATETVWLTVLGAPATYLPWAPTEPDADDCVLLGHGGGIGVDGLFFAFPCVGGQNFVCECE